MLFSSIFVGCFVAFMPTGCVCTLNVASLRLHRGKTRVLACRDRLSEIRKVSAEGRAGTAAAIIPVILTVAWQASDSDKCKEI